MKPYDVGLVCGRFHTFHKGHEKLVDTGLLLCDRLLILIGSAQESGTERNPFNINTRTKILREIYGDRPEIMICALQDMTDENDICPEWGRYLLNNVDRYIYKNPELMIYGNNESRSGWFDKKDLANTAELIVNRQDLPISATMVREAMAKDDRKKWMSLVNPRLHKMYDVLRAELMSVPFYQELSKNQLKRSQKISYKEKEKETMNKAILMGRLTRDPDVRYSQGENPMAIARYTLAVDRRFKRDGEQSADFINCLAFGKSAEFAEKYFKQGTKIAVSGRIQTGSYTNREGVKVYTTEVVIEEQEFAESKAAASQNNNRGASQPSTPQPSTAASDGFMNIPDGLEDELPFN